MVMRGVKHFSIFVAALAICAAAFFAGGCTGRSGGGAEIDTGPEIVARARVKKAAEKAPPPPTDFFPLKINFSWKYYLWNCPACPRTSIDSVITGKKQIGGKQVYLINKGNSGYFEDGDTVYLALINNGKLINTGVAGKHNLKPGDSWEIELDSKGKVTTGDEARTADGKKKRAWKYELKTQGAKKKAVCGRPELMGFPSDEPTRQAYFNTICCRVISDVDGEKQTEHASCYAAGVGLVAEYFTDAKSEIASYSIDPKALKAENEQEK